MKTRLLNRTTSIAMALALAACGDVNTQATSAPSGSPDVSTSTTQPGACQTQERFAVVVHGGAGLIMEFPTQEVAFIHKIVTDARADLQAGGAALDVVERLVMQMEDSGIFNAGKASRVNLSGLVETDASIMDGRTMDAGAVASMTGIKNPVRAARMVMEQTRHVMMVGDRGEATVTALGAETAEPDYFINNDKTPEEAVGVEHPDEEHGTVGAAVLDRCGDLAAATSTGGYARKTSGRVGDSPIIGASTYAKNGVMATSTSGHGEYFIRHNATISAASRVMYGNQSMDEAIQAVLDEMEASAGNGTDGLGGIIAVDAEGNVSMLYSARGMMRGYATHAAPTTVGAFEEMSTEAPQ